MKKDIAQKWMMTMSQSQTDTMNAQMDRCKKSIASLDDSIKAAGKDTTKAASFKSQKEMLKTGMESMSKGADEMKNAWVEFKSDGTIDASDAKMKGKWEINESDKKLITTGDDGKVDTMNIVELTKDKLSLSMGKDSKETMDFVPATGGTDAAKADDKDGDKKDGDKK